jgi:hypothetical protein
MLIRMDRAGGIHQGRYDLSSLSLGYTREVNELLHIGLVIANPETFYPIGGRSLYPEGDDIARGTQIEGGETSDLVGPTKRSSCYPLGKNPDPLPGIFIEITHLNSKCLRTYRGNGSVSNLIHHFRNRGYMIGPHRKTPKTLLRIPYGLIDKLDLVAHVMIILLSNLKFIKGEDPAFYFTKTYEDVDYLF